MMSSGSGGGGRIRAEADRWLATSEKLLASGDLQGAKTFAIRACETDPKRTQATDYIIAVCDTLLGRESRAGDTSLPDWYGVLRLGRLAQNPEVIATQYRRLALLLNPALNHLPYADQAFRLVSDAWYVLSDPSRKALYDRELQLSQFGQLEFQSFNQLPQQSYQQYHQFQQPQQHTAYKSQHQQQQPKQDHWQSLKHYQAQPTRSTKNLVEEDRQNMNNVTESTRQSRSSVPAQPSWASEQAQPNQRREPAQPSGNPESVQYVARPFKSVEPGQSTSHLEPTQASQAKASAESSVPSLWTACPYCFTLFEYAKEYEECILRCQSCRRAFQAVTILSPPVTEKNIYFCSWSFFPLGFTGNIKPSGWSPISPLFPCPMENVEQNQKKHTGRKSVTPRFHCDDDNVYAEIFDESEEEEDDEDDDDWLESEIRKKKKTKRESTSKYNKKRNSERLWQTGQSTGDGPSGSTEQESVAVGSSSGVTKAVGQTERKKTGSNVKNLGKLDLNVEFSNEVAREWSRGNDLNKEEDNIEGIGFFEGLDEFLSSLPILVPDDKVKAA